MKVYVVGEPKIDWAEWGRFVEEEGLPQHVAYWVSPASDSEILAEMAGRLCYMSYGKGRKTTQEFLGHIIDVGHFSVLEHANWTLIITGISRSCSHELVRHRHFSFSQLSQRYVDHTEMPIIDPPGMPEQLKPRWEQFKTTVRELYAQISAEVKAAETTSGTKQVRTIARSVLPQAIETKITVTGNARTWREFIQKRNIAAADPEIRELARTIHVELLKRAPLLFLDIDEG